ncbi:phosphatase PAP2 family protein [Candidatus Sumerlaeota bacterium]|nr:phosphatase PAP2 family protein [Candidatus Sumerlaeota bacterium]
MRSRTDTDEHGPTPTGTDGRGPTPTGTDGRGPTPTGTDGHGLTRTGTALDRLNLLYAALVSVIIVVCHRRIAHWYVPLGAYVGLIVVLFGFLRATAGSTNTIARFVRDWYTPFLFIFHFEFTYTLNQSVAPLYASWLSWWVPDGAFNPEHLGERFYFDALFVLADERLFGFQPSVRFSQALPWRWLGEIMYMFYFSFYCFVPFLGAALWFRGKQQAFEDMMFRSAFTMWMCCLVFIILPAAGPRYFFTPEAYHPNNGYLFSWIINFLFTHGDVPNGAFPSSHVAVTLAVTAAAYRHERRLFPWLFIVFAGLCTSVVYIGEHYAVDVAGGWVAGMAFYTMAVPLRRLLGWTQTGTDKHGHTPTDTDKPPVSSL